MIGLGAPVIVEAGSQGLLLACELAAANVRMLIDKREQQDSNLTRTLAVHARRARCLIGAYGEFDYRSRLGDQ
jgi:hypothetical protein